MKIKKKKELNVKFNRNLMKIYAKERTKRRRGRKEKRIEDEVKIKVELKKKWWKYDICIRAFSKKLNKGNKINEN